MPGLIQIMLILGKQKPLFWTNHAKSKIIFYKLSEARVRRVLHSPKRIEEGIAPDTIAMMQPVSVKNKIENGDRKEIWNQEIWVMIQDTKEKRKVISAWRYPGMTKLNEGAIVGFIKKQYDDFINRR